MRGNLIKALVFQVNQISGQLSWIIDFLSKSIIGQQTEAKIKVPSTKMKNSESNQIFIN